MSVIDTVSEITYPDSDGNPMSDNTKQADAMVFLKTNLDALFEDDDDVFVAMDLLWYPVEGHPEIRVGPDVMLAFGRPKGYRGSYRQWVEGGVAPQVVIEILSPGNRFSEMQRKLEFYDRHGVEEYCLYDPDDFAFSVWHRAEAGQPLRLIHPTESWTSPRMGVRFEASGEGELRVFGPDGAEFQSPLEIRRNLAVVEGMRDRAEGERDSALRRSARLAAMLRDLGVDPDAV